MAKVRVNWGVLEEGSVQLHEVRNRSGNVMLVLAKNAQGALNVACAANHIYDASTKIGEPFSRMADVVGAPWGEEMAKYWDLMQIAMSRNMQGTVHFEDGGVSIGYESVKP